MSDFSNLYPNGLPIHNPQWNVPQQPNYESEWLARLVGLEAERDAAIRRAEAAEAKLALAECVLHDYGIYIEGLALAQQVKTLAERVRVAEAEIKRRNAAENRMFDGLERLTNGRNPDSSEVWYDR